MYSYNTIFISINSQRGSVLVFCVSLSAKNNFLITRTCILQLLLLHGCYLGIALIFISLRSYDSLCQRGSGTCVSHSANSILMKTPLESSILLDSSNHELIITLRKSKSWFCNCLISHMKYEICESANYEFTFTFNFYPYIHITQPSTSHSSLPITYHSMS